MKSMNCLLFLCIFSLQILEQFCSQEPVPRKHVPHYGVNARWFHEAGVFNYSTMLLREDLGLLVVGATGTLYALDLNDVSKKQASVKWEVTHDRRQCLSTKECENYIKVLLMNDTKMFVCGTNAALPQCRHMTFTDGKLTLQEATDWKGKIPKFLRSPCTSVMVDGLLYSAADTDISTNPYKFCKYNARNAIVCDRGAIWLNEPVPVSLVFVPESDNCPSKIYLFFIEKVDVRREEYPWMSRGSWVANVSRVSRVCAGDVGGKYVLQKQWTSFLKTSIVCPVVDQWSHVIQNTFLWKGTQEWTSWIVYAIFTSRRDLDDPSAVCEYSLSSISKVFSEGDFIKRAQSGLIFEKVSFSSLNLNIRPGVCLNNTNSQEEKKTLDYLAVNSLMDQTIQPLSGKPLLLRRGAWFTCIAVSQTEAADGTKHRVMFVGTGQGLVLKAVNYDGEMFIIEEMQVFKYGEAIRILKFSNTKRQLYASSDVGVAQIPVAHCERSSSCWDCVLARDPYCGWDTTAGKCVTLVNSGSALIQRLSDSDASVCPETPVSVTVHLMNQFTSAGGILRLHCPLLSGFSKSRWEHNNLTLVLSDRIQKEEEDLLIRDTVESDSGRYRCRSVEHDKNREYTTIVADYQVSIGSETGMNQNATIIGLLFVLGILVVSSSLLLSWNCYKGHIGVPCLCSLTRTEQSVQLHRGSRSWGPRKRLTPPAEGQLL